MNRDTNQHTLGTPLRSMVVFLVCVLCPLALIDRSSPRVFLLFQHSWLMILSQRGTQGSDSVKCTLRTSSFVADKKIHKIALSEQEHCWTTTKGNQLHVAMPTECNEFNFHILCWCREEAPIASDWSEAPPQTASPHVSGELRVCCIRQTAEGSQEQSCWPI